MDYNKPYLLNTIDSFKSRRALTLYFNDGQAGVLYADTLVYLTIEYIAQLHRNPELLKQHDNYMTKTPKDAELEIGLSQDKIRLIYKGLETSGLISIKKKGQDNRTCIKVDLDKVNDVLVEYSDKFEEMKKNYVDKQSEMQKKRVEQAKKHAQSKLDFEKLNAISEENNPKVIGELSEDYETCSLIYIVNHYYKRYTNKTYRWEPIKFNTLMTTWRGRADRQASELGMSIALHTELNNKSYDSIRPFELRVRETYSPDVRINDYNCREYEDVLFDDIMQLNPNFRKYFN